MGFQISRHWRLNSQRYRLQGVRYENGEVSLQARPNPSGIEQGMIGIVKGESKVAPEKVNMADTRPKQ